MPQKMNTTTMATKINLTQLAWALRRMNFNTGGPSAGDDSRAGNQNQLRRSNDQRGVGRCLVSAVSAGMIRPAGWRNAYETSATWPHRLGRFGDLPGDYDLRQPGG